MSDPLPNLLTEWCALLLGSLRQAGVRDVVISPGSRSTPLVLAAARCPGLRLHDVIDERAAAFFALGQARVTGAPSVLLCTSGTAGAHYLPAVIEAGMAHVPLLALTADRPFELQGCAAPQTIDQVKLFGDHARAYLELGMPDASDGALRALRRIAAQATLLARWPRPGAVHLNARARKPLEPVVPAGGAAAELAARVRALLAEPLPRAATPRAALDDEAAAELAARLRRARRGLIVCGPAPLAQRAHRGAILALARAAGMPLLCEASSQLRFAGAERGGALTVDLFDGLLRAARLRGGAQPDLILQLGAPPTSGAWEGLLAAHPRCPLFVVAPQGWSDPTSRAAALHLCEPAEAARALLPRLGAAPAPDSERERWLGLWRRADAVARRVAAEELAHAPASEGALVAAAVSALPRGSLLVLGNSLPIREVDALCPGELADVGVLSQRGANGIDGLVSGAAGAASVAGAPVTLLLGDISFLHDLSGLGAARGLPAPLSVVVLHNQGGRIFEQLPIAQGSTAEPALRYFTTPHQLELGHAARLFGHAHARVDSPDALKRALRASHDRPGCTVIEAVVEPGSAAEQRRRVDAALAAALHELPTGVLSTQGDLQGDLP